MSAVFYTDQGNTITLAKRLGEGGEGYVHAIQESSTLVAKLYHISHLPDTSKQAKLSYMIANADSKLIEYSAWPLYTLHKRQGGRIIGFLMAKVYDCAPIHTLYNPSHRRHTHPNSTWQFLLYCARNIATAFEVLHSHNHVIGDVNQGNLLFKENSQIVLIDADSFQIKTSRVTYLCKVGVAHFTPPELQGHTQFDKVARTQNHDNFGLAVLIFHLLFGGRHPYAGVPLIEAAGKLLEKDIKAYRYAYAVDCDKRGIKPPHTAIPVQIIPDNIKQLFERAFTQQGAVRRPSAEDWINALDKLRDNLQSCHKNRRHIYSNHLFICPWCQLEQRGLVYFGKYDPNAIGFQADTCYERLLIYRYRLSNLPIYTIEGLLLDPNLFTVSPAPINKILLAESYLWDYLMKCNPKFIQRKLLNSIQLNLFRTSKLLSAFIMILIFILLIPLYAIFIGLYIVLAEGIVLTILTLIFSAATFIWWLLQPFYFGNRVDYFILILGFFICFLPVFGLAWLRIVKLTEYRHRQQALSQAAKLYMQIKLDLNKFQHLIDDYDNKKNDFIKKTTQLEKLQDAQRRNKSENKHNLQTQRQYIYLTKELDRLHKDINRLCYSLDSVYKDNKDKLRHKRIVKAYAQAKADYNLAANLKRIK